MQCNKTIIGRTRKVKSSYSHPEKRKKKKTHKLQSPSQKLGKINTLNNVFFKALTELKSTSAGKLFQTVPGICYSFTAEGAAYSRTVWFVEFLHMSSGMRCRAQDKNNEDRVTFSGVPQM